MKALGRAWPNQTELLDVIESRIKEETAYTFVEWTIEYLAKYWSGNIKALEIVVKLGGYKYNVYSEYASRFGFYSYLYMLENKNVRRIVVNAVVDSWQDYPITPLTLCSLITTSTEPGVYVTACEALVGGWRNSPQSFDLLFNQAKTEFPTFKRANSLRIIAQTWGSHPEVNSLLKYYASFSLEYDVKLTAIGGLFENKHSDAAIMPLLQEIAINDKQPNIRTVVLELLSGYSPSHNIPSLMIDYKFFEDLDRSTSDKYDEDQYGNLILSLLYSRAVEDSDASVRTSILNLIYRQIAYRADALTFLITRCMNDENLYVRAAVLAIFAEDELFLSRHYKFPNYSKQIDFLDINSILNGSAFYYDEQAIKKTRYFSKHRTSSWFKDPKVLSLFYNRVKHDSDPGVRIMAIRTLVRYGLVPKETKLLLKERINSEPDPNVKSVAEKYLHLLESVAKPKPRKK